MGSPLDIPSIGIGSPRKAQKGYMITWVLQENLFFLQAQIVSSSSSNSSCCNAREKEKIEEIAEGFEHVLNKKK